jgi:hypothetical protein
MFLISKQDRYLRRFEQAGAVHPAAARTLEELGLRETGVFRGLARRGLFVSTLANRYYLVAGAARRFLDWRRQAALDTLGAAALLVALAWLVRRWPF